jgi:N6-adenosine-specific RNA methylase IME4
MAAWGFRYHTGFVWDKEIIGTGYWNRNQHEHLLIGIRGTPENPYESLRVSSIYREKRGEHSAKPAFFYDWISKVWPDKRKLEMYARNPRPGWAVWGNEVAPAATH